MRAAVTAPLVELPSNHLLQNFTGKVSSHSGDLWKTLPDTVGGQESWGSEQHLEIPEEDATFLPNLHSVLYENSSSKGGGMHVQPTSRSRTATPDWLKPTRVLLLDRVLHGVLHFIALPYYRAGAVFGMQTQPSIHHLHIDVKQM